MLFQVYFLTVKVFSEGGKHMESNTNKAIHDLIDNIHNEQLLEFIYVFISRLIEEDD